VLKEENNLGMVITLLKEKNSYLETFLEVSEKERKSFKARNFDNLEVLYAIREDILENIRSIDRRIEKYSRDLQPENLGPEDRDVIKKLMSQKQSLVNGIMAQDLVMLSCVENEKSSMIKKMTGIKDGRRLLKAYRFMPDIVD
jgi:hypothetical protein